MTPKPAPPLRRILSTRERTARIINSALDEHEQRHREELLALCRVPRCVLLHEIARLIEKLDPR